MKKYLLLFVLFGYGLSNLLYASHVMGGEITIAPTNVKNEVLITVITYSERIRSVVYNLDVEFGNSKVSITTSLVKTDILYSYPSVIRHFHQVTYRVTDTSSYHTVSGSVASRYGMNWAGGGGAVFIKSGFMPGNHTAIFAGPPITAFPLDSLWHYNPMPIDFDGDSLHWRISVPKVNATDTLPGYYPPPANPGGDFSIDPATGVVSWNASQIGLFIYAISVTEWRNGVVVGKIKRDMKAYVVPNVSQLKIIPPSNPNITTLSGVNTISLTANSSNSFQISISSADSAADLRMEAIGAPFELDSNSGATFSTVLKKSGSGTLEGTFDWTPPASLKGKDFRLMVRVSDSNFSYDYSLVLRVEDVFSLKENESGQKLFEVFPNPTEDVINFRSIFYKGNFVARLTGVNGQVLKESSFETGNNYWTIENFDAGLYILELEFDDHLERHRILLK